MRPNRFAAPLILFALIATSTASAQLTSPKIGWTADLSTLQHGVSGSVTIVDEDTVRVDDFTYDGGGIIVLFYLGESDTKSAFEGGLGIGEDLFGTAYDGSQPAFTVDLPQGETIEGLNAISVWCVAAGVNFGSGTFLAPPLPGDFNGDGIVDAGDYTVWRDHLGNADELAIQNNGDGQNGVDIGDYDVWAANFAGNATGAGSVAVGRVAAVPEPSAWLLFFAGIAVASTWRCRI